MSAVLVKEPSTGKFYLVMPDGSLVLADGNLQNLTKVQKIEFDQNGQRLDEWFAAQRAWLAARAKLAKQINKP